MENIVPGHRSNMVIAERWIHEEKGGWGGGGGKGIMGRRGLKRGARERVENVTEEERKCGE